MDWFNHQLAKYRHFRHLKLQRWPPGWPFGRDRLRHTQEPTGDTTPMGSEGFNKHKLLIKTRGFMGFVRVSLVIYGIYLGLMG